MDAKTYRSFAEAYQQIYEDKGDLANNGRKSVNQKKELLKPKGLKDRIRNTAKFLFTDKRSPEEREHYAKMKEKEGRREAKDELRRQKIDYYDGKNYDRRMGY